MFAAAGRHALVHDNRNTGASDGEPRQELDPWAQVRDDRHAITYAGTLDEVDATRIGIWGSSYSGGHVLVVGAIDRRVKAVVARVPLVSGSANIGELVEDEPGSYVGRISPTPLLLVVARGDHLTPAHLSIDAHEHAREPTRLVILPGGRFDAYAAGLDQAGGAARDWFVEHLTS